MQVLPASRLEFERPFLDRLLGRLEGKVHGLASMRIVDVFFSGRVAPESVVDVVFAGTEINKDINPTVP